MAASIRALPDAEREPVVGGHAVEGRRSAGIDRLSGVPQPGIEEGVDDRPGSVVLRLHRELVDKAPGPVLVVLQRLHERVGALAEMLRGVAVRARVAAIRRPADQALPGGDPRRADRDTRRADGDWGGGGPGGPPPGAAPGPAPPPG